MSMPATQVRSRVKESSAHGKAFYGGEMNQQATVNGLDAGLIANCNKPLIADLDSDYAALAVQLARRAIDIAAVTRKVSQFSVALPSWGVGTGGTRFARFPGSGEPRNVFEKLEDCAVIHQLTGATPTVSLHLPWDVTSDLRALKEHAQARGLGFDAVNSNTFQDQRIQSLSYKFGSLTHTDSAVREQAIAHNLDFLCLGTILGSHALQLL